MSKLSNLSAIPLAVLSSLHADDTTHRSILGLIDDDTPRARQAGKAGSARSGYTLPC